MTSAAVPTASSDRPPITLGGRMFHQATSTTIDQDAYVSKRFRTTGIAQTARSFRPNDGELGELSERLLWEALDSGVMYEILAGALVEPGVTWSRQVAAANATFFRGLTDARDKETLFTRMGDVVFDFLVIAALSGARSLNSESSPKLPATSGDHADGDVVDRATSNPSSAS